MQLCSDFINRPQYSQISSYLASNISENFTVESQFITIMAAALCRSVRDRIKKHGKAQRKVTETSVGDPPFPYEVRTHHR